MQASAGGRSCKPASEQLARILSLASAVMAVCKFERFQGKSRTSLQISPKRAEVGTARRRRKRASVTKETARSERSLRAGCFASNKEGQRARVRAGEQGPARPSLLRARLKLPRPARLSPSTSSAPACLSPRLEHHQHLRSSSSSKARPPPLTGPRTIRLRTLTAPLGRPAPSHPRPRLRSIAAPCSALPSTVVQSSTRRR